MTSGTATPNQRAEAQPLPTQAEGYIEHRIQQTRRHVKGVDIAQGLMTLAVGLLAYLLVAAVIDHWLVPGGLGFWGRLFLLVGLLGAGGYYFRRRVLPPLVYRINPIYAADTIEKGRPSLKNSLINFLLLRGHRQEVPQFVYQALQQRAAADLSQVHADTAVDRAHVVRLGYVLAGTLAAFCLYLVISPKNPLSSAARILWPWARIDAPTRVTIREVTPGNVDKFFGEFATVSAEVKGLKEREEVTLYYSTADEQAVDQAIPMARAEGASRFSAVLPPGSQGLQQDYDYYLSAGDAATERFTIKVLHPPAITVDAIAYHYPPYTRIADRRLERQGGDIREREGTEVTIYATANQEIKDAKIDFGSDSVPMNVQGSKAVGRFTLRLAEDDPPRAEHESYQLRFTARSGKPNRWPSRYAVEVIPDQKPEVELLAPQEAEVQLAQDGRLEIRVRAKDPDFALRRVALQASQGERTLSIPPLLSQPAPKEPWQGEFQGTYVFEPTKLRLKAGTRVAYWAEAEDNKEPEANRSATERRWIEIVGPETIPQPPQRNEAPAKSAQQPQGKPNPAEPRPNELPEPENGPEKEQPQQPDGEQPPKEAPQPKPGEPPEQGPNAETAKPEEPKNQDAKPSDGSAEGKSGTAGKGAEQSAEKSAEERREPVDNDGEAIEEINKDRQERQQEGAGKPDQQQGAGKPDQQQGAGKPDQQQGAGKPDQQQGAGKPDQQQGAGKPDQQQGAGKPDQQQGAGKPDQQQGAGKPDQQQGAGKPDQQQGAGKPDQQQGAGKPEQQPPGEANQEQSPAGKGRPTDDGQGTTEPQGDNQQPRGKKPSEPEQVPPEKSAEPISPSISGKQSDGKSKGIQGDQSGGGGKGGGEQANQPGEGSPGSHNDAESGGAKSNKRGAGEVGKRAGDEVETDKKTGKSTIRRDGKGSGKGQEEPSDRIGKTPLQSDSPGGKGSQPEPGSGTARPKVTEQGGAHGQGNPTTGGAPGKESEPPPPARNEEAGSEEPNLKYAHMQADLALEHLRDELAKEKPEVLNRLGWSRAEAQRFLERWEQLMHAAGRSDARGKAAKQELDEALRSLGLRRHGTEIKGGQTGRDQLRDLRDTGRYRPPADWAEQIDAYKRGVAGGGR
jgi:hypothetical protein